MSTFLQDLRQLLQNVTTSQAEPIVTEPSVVPTSWAGEYVEPEVDDVICPTLQLTVGDWVEFKSPIFGVCSGYLSKIGKDDLGIFAHSFLKSDCDIKRAWVTKVLDGPPQGNTRE